MWTANQTLPRTIPPPAPPIKGYHLSSLKSLPSGLPPCAPQPYSIRSTADRHADLSNLISCMLLRDVCVGSLSTLLSSNFRKLTFQWHSLGFCLLFKIRRINPNLTVSAFVLNRNVLKNLRDNYWVFSQCIKRYLVKWGHSLTGWGVGYGERGRNWVSELEHFGLGSLGIPIFGAKSRCCSGSMKFKDGRIMGWWKTGKNMSPGVLPPDTET